MVNCDNSATLAFHDRTMTDQAIRPPATFKKALRAWQDIAIPGSFSSKSYFEKGAARKGRTVPLPSDVHLKQALTYQAWRRPARKIKRRTYPSFYFSSRFEADTVDFGTRLDKQPSHCYILLIIDAFSRKLFTHPLTNKKGLSVRKGLVKIFQNLKAPYTIPHLLEFDRGKEFTNRIVQKFLEKKYSDSTGTRCQ